MTREEAKEIISRHHWSFASMDYEVIEAIECLAEECEDAISRQAVLDEMEKRHKEGDCITKGFINKLPSVPPKQKMGRWVANENSMPFEYPYSCNRCTMSSFFKTPFCPNCGAKMVEPQESEEG